MWRRLLVALVIGALPSLLNVSAAAAAAAAPTFTWSGGAGNGRWSSLGNWRGGVVPPAGSNIVFPNLGLAQSTRDDLAPGTSMASLTFRGFWSMTGVPLTITGLLSVAGQSHVQIADNLKLRGPETIVVDTACCVGTNNGLALSGLTTGDGGPIHLTGPGLVEPGSPSFAGGWDIENGELDSLNNGLGTGPVTVTGTGAAFLDTSPTGPPVAFPNAFSLSGSGTGGGALGTYGPVNLSGTVHLAASASISAGLQPLTLAGTLSGVAGAQLTKIGSGAVVIPTVMTTAPPGGAIVAAGSLQVDGQFAAPLAIDAGGQLTGTGGTDAVTVRPGGVVAPGDAPPWTGRLTLAALTMRPGGVLKVGIGGTGAGTTYGQLAVTGTVSVAGTLGVNVGAGFTPGNGEAFRIIDNRGAAAIRGTFAGLQDGSNLTAGKSTFDVTRHGGTGNDLVLRDVAAPHGLQVTAASPAVLGQGASAIALTASGVALAPGDTVSFSGPAVTVSSTSYVNTTTLTAKVTVAVSAALGGQNVVVTTRSGSSAACSFCFTVSPGPSISRLTPPTLPRGSVKQAVYVSGTHFEPGATARFSGNGVKVISTSVPFDFELRLVVTVSLSASLGARDLVVTNPDHGVAVCTSCLSVTT